MKARLFLIFTILVVSSGTALSQTPTPSATTPKPTVTTKLNQPQKTKTFGSELAQNLEALDKNFTTIVLFLAKLIGIILSLLVIQRILLLIIYRSSQLIIENFHNATGADELDNVLPGLSQLARERLVRDIKGVHLRVREHIQRLAPQTYGLPDNLPLPRSTPDQRLADLVASLNEFTPDQIDPVVQLLKVIFPPFGTKVTSMMQSQGEDHKRIGITFEVTDIEGRVASRLYTVWESPEDRIAHESAKLVLKDRFRLLLRIASRWLAIELCRQEMVKAIPLFFFGKGRKSYQSKIHNFFGVLYQTSAQTHGKFFYQLAIEDLQEAIELDPDWYQPYDNLAETYGLLGRLELADRKVNLFEKAIAYYHEALKRVKDSIVEQRIIVATAIAQLLTGKDIFIATAKQEIQNLEQNLDPTQILNYRLLYYLACWYAIASGLGIVEVEEAKTQARRYLAYSLARDDNRDFWVWVDKDPDLEIIRATMGNMKSAILKKLNQIPQLPTLTGEKFAKPLEEIHKNPTKFT